MNVIHRTKADFHAGVDHAKNRPIETWYYNTANPRAASAGAGFPNPEKPNVTPNFPYQTTPPASGIRFQKIPNLKACHLHFRR